MSTPRDPQPAKLVIGVLLNDKAIIDDLARELVQSFGDMDLISPWLAFDYTRYYEKEMGKTLSRRMMAFSSLIRQDELAEVKTITNNIESRYLNQGNRDANIDPGYLLLERFVLATGKNFSHRIYIGKKIYADLTLIYQKGEFQTLEWTYPDYAQVDIQNFLIKVREKYKMDLKLAAGH